MPGLPLPLRTNQLLTCATPLCPFRHCDIVQDALIATRNFWQGLMHSSIKFTVLASALNAVEGTVQRVGGRARVHR